MSIPRTMPELVTYVRRHISGRTYLEKNPLVEHILRGDVPHGAHIYASAFEEAAATSSRPKQRVVYLLEAVRGHLERPDTDEGLKDARMLLQAVWKLFPHVPRRRAQLPYLRKLYYKYAGELHCRLGAYRDAAYAKRMYAVHLRFAQEEDAALVQSFEAEVILAYEALRGTRHHIVRQTLERLRHASHKLEMESTESGNEVLRAWTQCMIPLHRMLTHHFSGIRYGCDEQDAVAVAGFAQDPQWSSQFGEWSAIACAIQHIWQLELPEALQCVRLARTQSSNEVRAVAHFLASYAHELKGAEKCHTHRGLHAILEVPATNWLIAALHAIAARRLKRRS